MTYLNRLFFLASVLISMSSYGDEPAGVLYPSNTELKWYGSENAMAYKELKKIDKDFSATAELSSRNVLIRQSPEDTKAIEVFNIPSKNWVPLRRGALQVSGKQYEPAAMADFVNSIRQEAFFKSTCRLAQVQVDLTKSTEKAAFYLQNVKLGDVDENGVFHFVKDGYCHDEVLAVLVAKKNCKQFSDTVKVVNNPQKYPKQIKLKNCR